MRSGPIGNRAWTLFTLIGALLLSPGFAAAASTSANLDGTIIDQSGAPIGGADIRIIHTESGTTRKIGSGPSGDFFQGGLRVGGPYRVEITAPGYATETLEDLYLRPGDQSPYRIRLRPDSMAIEEMVVSAQRIQYGRDLTNGVGSSYSADDIANQPSTKRDVIRTLLRDPLAQSDGEGNLSVAGINPRFNGLSIDGSLQQDDFGLGSNTYATERSPINLDAIESASLAASDYSVEVSGFTGGLVSINTKSGTNEFDGSAFYYYQDEDFLGDTFDGDRDFTPGEFEEEEYGFTLGGPILEDRLFFFVSYDEYESGSTVDFGRFDRNNGIQDGFFTALADVVEDSTGYRPIPRPAIGNTPVASERGLIKLDANISDQHRASFTYQSTEESGTSVDADEFEGAWYDVPVELDAYTGQLFSDWTPELSTTLRVNYKEFVRGQICRAGTDVGAIEIDNLDPADVVGTPLEGLFNDRVDLTAGCDRFRHANEFEDERLQVFAKADYARGDHLISVGGEYEDFELFNLFVPSSRGRFVFDGFDDLVAGNAQVDYVNVPSNNAQDGAASWGYEKWSLFAQDRWQITQDLELSYGLRYERFSQDEEPARSEEIALDFGIDSSNNLDGLNLFLPRVSFRYDGLERTKISGGLGLFAGGDPKVWISNAFQAPTVFARTDVADADVFNVPQTLLDTVGSQTPVPIDVIGEDFDIPSDWKASLRVDHQFDARFGDFDLGEDYSVTAQYLYTRVQDGFLWTNLAQTRLPEALPTGTAPDGRPIYADLDDLGILNLTELGNYDDGESHVLSLGLSKQFDNGLDVSFSYAWQDIEATTEGNSSRGISNWRGIVSTDRNNPQPRTSPFEVEHSFKLSLGYERDFLPGLTTRMDLFGRLLKDDPFTYTFDVSSNNALFGRAGAGERPFDNNPLYIPTGPTDPLVVYGSGFDQGAFFSYVDSKGIDAGVHEVNSEYGGWNQIWDFQLQQELPGIPGIDRYVGENRLRLELNIDNVLNLLNDDWGRFTSGPSFGQQRIVAADLVSAADLAANGVDGAMALTGDAPRNTCRTASDCVYRFNDFDDDPTSQLNGSNSIYRIRLGIRMEF